MKEMFFAFVIALVIGSIWNSVKSDQAGASGGGATCGIDSSSSSAAIANGSFPNGPQSMQTAQQAQAGQELVVDVDEGSFQGYVLDAREPVLVEFYTDNCPHCNKMGPVMGQLAFNGQGIVRVCKVNATKSAALAERYDVAGVPAFVLFSEGHMLDSTSGARSVEDMRAWLGQNNITVPASVGANFTNPSM